MMTLYYSPGACSSASHIGIEETGATYEIKPTLLAKGQQKTEAYLKINPRGKVPALRVDGKILTENTAMLTYLAKKFPAGADASRSRRRSPLHRTMAWLSNVVHPSYQRSLRPERFAEGEAAAGDGQRKWPEVVLGQPAGDRLNARGKRLDHGPRIHRGRSLRAGFLRLGERSGYPVKDLKAYTAWQERMMKRPTVKKSVESEQSVAT